MKDFHSGTEGLICQKNCEGWMVGVWEGLNLGSIPNDHMPSQKDPKIPIERRCSTILPIRDRGLRRGQIWCLNLNRDHRMMDVQFWDWFCGESTTFNTWIQLEVTWHHTQRPYFGGYWPQYDTVGFSLLLKSETWSAVENSNTKSHLHRGTSSFK